MKPQKNFKDKEINKLFHLNTKKYLEVDVENDCTNNSKMQIILINMV